MNESDQQNQNQNSGPNNPDDLSRLKGNVAKRNMATASMVCGIIALITMQIFFISLPLAGVSIILALLSRTDSGLPAGRARIAVICGAAAMVLSSLITVYAARQIYTNPQLRAQVEDLYNYYSGRLYGTQDNARESEEEQPLSESPQEILQNILSGDYRRNQSGENSGRSVSQSPEQQVAAPAISGSGGAYI